RHAIADDKRADRTAGEPDKQDREGTADLEVDVEEGVGREKIVEGPDRPIKPGAKHATPPETPTCERGNDDAPRCQCKLDEISVSEEVLRSKSACARGQQGRISRREPRAGQGGQALLEKTAAPSRAVSLCIRRIASAASCSVMTSGGAIR